MVCQVAKRGILDLKQIESQLLDANSDVSDRQLNDSNDSDETQIVYK